LKRPNLSDELILEALLPFGVTGDRELAHQIRTYVETLVRWNEKISLTAVTDPREIVRIHFGESFFAAAAAGIVDGRLADIGTGAGFPGIPIRMARTGIRLTLVEPVAKKAAFLGEILRNIGIRDASIMRCRMEEVTREAGPFDWITARALGKYEALLRWSKMRISQSGSIVLLLGDSDAEQIARDPSWAWREPVRIPESKGRVVLWGSARS
jgi:16S rRNA (guanine527-N7)-methyltransferase